MPYVILKWQKVTESYKLHANGFFSNCGCYKEDSGFDIMSTYSLRSSSFIAVLEGSVDLGAENPKRLRYYEHFLHKKQTLQQHSRAPLSICSLGRCLHFNSTST